MLQSMLQLLLWLFQVLSPVDAQFLGVVALLQSQSTMLSELFAKFLHCKVFIAKFLQQHLQLLKLWQHLQDKDDIVTQLQHCSARLRNRCKAAAKASCN